MSETIFQRVPCPVPECKKLMSKSSVICFRHWVGLPINLKGKMALADQKSIPPTEAERAELKELVLNYIKEFKIKKGSHSGKAS